MKIKKIPPASTFRDYPLLIKNILAYSLMLEPEREIVYRDQLRYNYYTFNERVRRLANVLDHLGLTGGETIGVMDYDSHRYLECYFAIPMTGNVLHTINWRLSPAQILYTINHAEDQVLIVHEDFLPVIERFAGEMSTVRHIIVTSEGPVTIARATAASTPPTIAATGTPPMVAAASAPSLVAAVPAHPYEPLLAAASPIYDFPDFDEQAVATTFYTTGTTGDPKGVFFTHRQLVLHTLSLASTFGFVDGASCRFRSDDVYMPLTPMFHVHAWGFPFLATMYSMKQVYPGKLSPPMVVWLQEHEKPTFSHCVPTILQLVLACPEGKDLDLSGWKVMVGGSALPEALARAAMERGIDVMVGYGMSETCPVISTCYIRQKDKDRELEWHLKARTRSGIPVALTDIQVWNEAGESVREDDHDSGEVVARAPWLTQGYVREPEKGAALWKEGYLHTGDVATVNADRSLKISDRIKDVIKSGGEWISSIDLENLIGLHPAVAEVAVVGLPHPKWGERPYALVVLRKDQTVVVEQLIEHIRRYIDKGQISKWALPEQMVLVESIPKTSVGKIDKKRIRAELAQE